MEVILWQFTVRGEHPVAAVALREMLWLLEEQHKAVIRGLYFAVPAEVYGQWKSRERQKSDESIDVASEAARSAIQNAQQAQPGLTRPHAGYPGGNRRRLCCAMLFLSLIKPVLCSAC